MGGGVITPPYNGWYETYNHHFDDQLTKADNLKTNLSFLCITRRNNVPSRVPGGDVGVRIYFAGEAERSVTSW